jgi:hypothetical protein
MQMLCTLQRMNAEQITRYTELEQTYGRVMDLTPGMQSLIRTLACVEVEEETLQAFCNEHGTCYMVTGKSGDVYSRARPEWQQLKEARMRKQALVARLEMKLGSANETEENVEQYFG